MFPQRLIDGYRAFLGDRFVREQDRYEALAEEGQSPEILLIGCCDSRVSPEVIFDASPGELLIVRNVATSCRLSRPAARSTAPARRSSSPSWPCG